MNTAKILILVAVVALTSVGCEMHAPQKPKSAEAEPAATPQKSGPAPQFFPAGSNE